MSLLSVIVPCWNEEEAIPFFYEEFSRVRKLFGERFPNISFELLFVDDGSSDQSLKKIKELKEKDSAVRYVTFSRNFGKDAALFAGLDNAKGDYVVCMDADLQDPPSLLPEMFEAVYSGGYDSAATRRVTRKGEPPVRSFFARLFYKLMNHISTTEIVDGARDYRIMTRQMVDAILSMKEYNRFTKGIYGWIGFKTKWIEFENVERVAGETKWSFWKLFRYAMEGIVDFSTVPLTLILWIGGVFSLLSGISLIACLVLYVREVLNSVPLILSAIAFSFGLQLFFLGIVAHYLANTYMEAKGRPLYIAKEIT
ncbi:MAG: glycosyltransferase family 2 protein [Lachnospiraceae bacterium]|nr:glycosyltransferase family 2 protein [Lachnospiraceae bacterium]